MKRRRPSLPSIPHGDPGPASHARGAVEVAHVPVIHTVDARGNARVHNVTVLRRKPPALVTGLKQGGRAAVDRYADTAERIGAIPAVEWGIGVEGGGVGDGGIAGAVDLVTEINRVHGHLRGYEVALVATRARSKPITVIALLSMTVVGHYSPGAILRAHHWGRSARNQQVVARAFGWTVKRLEAIYGLDEWKRMFDPLPNDVRKVRNRDALCGSNDRVEP